MKKNLVISELFVAHRAALIDYATPIVGDRGRAEDVVQEAFIRFMPAQQAAVAAGPSAVEQPLAYLYRIVRNLAVDGRRRKALERRQEEAVPLWWTVPAAPRTPEQELAYRDNLARVRDALAQLSPEARTALEMHRFGGYTLNEIADRLGLSPTKAHRLIRDALVRIAHNLANGDASSDDAKESRAIRLMTRKV